MDIRELIVLGGVVLVVLVVGHGLWSAWSKHRSRLRMRIEPELVPADDEEDWLNAELPTGNARVVQPDEAQPAETESAPVEAVEQPAAEEPAPQQQRTAPPPRETDFFAERNADDAPAPQQPRPQPAAPAPALADAGGRQEAPAAKPEDEAQKGAANAPVEERALIVVHVLAPAGQRFAGDALLAALRAAGLKYGAMKIFHRLQPQSQKTVFSVANAVEPGYFDLGGDCSSPGVTAFLELTGAEQDFAALDDLMQTAQSIAEALGGALQDERRRPFTSSTLERYRGRVASFVRQHTSA